MKKVASSVMAGSYPNQRPIKPDAPTFKTDSKARVNALRKRKKK